MGSSRRLAAFTVLAVISTLAEPASAQTDRLGKVTFPTSCSAAAQTDFERGVAYLHSFWFDAAIRSFTAAAQADPGCGIAHWGVAMSLLGNPLAAPPTPKALQEGWAAVEKARAAGARTPRERDYVAAIETFYKDADKVDHRTRVLAYEQAMERLVQRHPEDREGAIFYALALNVASLPTDKTYAKQLKAAAVLERVFAEQPQHPGVAHYLIHSYDYPPIAQRGLDAARRYAGIAPSAPHALHMPSHIFTRVGYWQDSIESNRASAAAAKDAFNRLHAMDYMAYGYLQLARDTAAKQVADEVVSFGKPTVEHIAVAYALAAIPARYALERGRWAEAAALALPQPEFAWSKFPPGEAIVVFARALGAARSGDLTAARKDTERLKALSDALTAAKSAYWAEQVDIQRLVATAWIARAEARNAAALELMRAAADREDATEKHPVTPGPIAPARELLGELLLELGQPTQALAAFERSQRAEPNRFRGLYGAARAAELAGDRAKARDFYGKLVALAGGAGPERPELRQAKAFLGGQR